MPIQKPIKQLLQKVGDRIDELDADVLLAYVLRCPREYLIAHLSDSVSRWKASRFRRLVRKRSQGVPLAYLTGHKEFFGLNFIVNKHLLIPRPETEVLVESVLAEIESQMSDVKCQMLLIDIGTGSGCIPISIIKSLKHESIKTVAIDIDRRALQVAEKNAARHGVVITFLHGNLLSPLLERSLFPVPCSLILTANLPYLTEAQYQSEPSIQHEPKHALVAGNNGLALYERLLKQIKSFISSFPHFPISCFFEIDPSQSQSITLLIHTYLSSAKVTIKTDLAGRERVIIIKT